MIAHLRDEVGPGGESVAHHFEFGELMHEGFLAVEMFVVLQCGQHGGRMMEIGHVHNYGIEIIDAIGEGFAIIAKEPGVGMLLFDLIEFAAVHVAEPGPFHLGMTLQAASLQAADPPHADLEDAQLAVFVDLRPGGERERGEAGSDDSTGLEEAAAGDRRKGMTFGLRVHNEPLCMETPLVQAKD